MVGPGDPDGRAFVLRTPELVLGLDRRGTVVSAAPAARLDASWLTHVGSLDVTTPDGSLALGPPLAVVDTDEVEVTRSGGGLRSLVRHSVDATWDVRVVLANESDTELVLTQVRLGCRADPRSVVTALAANAVTAYAVQPGNGDGPVLVARLRSGAQAGVDENGFLLGPLVLAPGHRWSASWRFEVVADARRAATGDLPRTAWLDLDQTVVLAAGPDVAVVAPALAVEEDPGGRSVEVGAGEPGTWGIELRGARGTTVYELSWAPDLDDVVDAATERVLGGPTTPAGTTRLPDPAAGLVVQDALGRRSVGATDDLADALELLGGTLVERVDPRADPQPDPDPFALAFLTREADRTDDRTLLDAAARALVGVAVPGRGVGLTGLAMALSQVRSGGPADAARQLGALAVPHHVGPGTLELALLLRPRGAPADETVLAGLRRLGAEHGAGLPGRVLPPLPLDEVAYASTLLGLVDEGTGQRLQAVWGCTAAELARRTAAQARARIAERPDDPVAWTALAWLVLGRPPR